MRVKIREQTTVFPKTFGFYEVYQRHFTWLTEANNWVKEIKRQSKEQDFIVKTKILLGYQSKDFGNGKTESKVTDYYVRWYFMPNGTTLLERLFAPSL